MDGQVSAGIQGYKGLPLFPTTAESFTTGEVLFFYLAVSSTVVSAALVREEDKV